ncbi:MAG TPA: hypothetical protein VN651_09275 [Gemmatimonadaceae bacterium]|nr:hypothetical protein [Gemmatimonadaceae bacterium]
MRLASVMGLLMIATGGASGAAQSPGASRAPAALNARPRLLGVFDENTGEPVEGARVADLVSGTFATTTQTGTVALNFLRDSGSLVRVQKIGYETQVMFVGITGADTAPITLVLRRITDLPASVTRADSASRYLSPALRAFDERRRSGAGGYFIDEADLRKLDNSTLGNAVRRLPGITVLPGMGSADWLMRNARCAEDGGGPPQVYVDGVQWTPPLRPDAPRFLGRDIDGIAFDLHDFQVSNLAGVEFYPDNAVAPSEFAHTSKRCGILLLWTRER